MSERTREPDVAPPSSAREPRVKDDETGSQNGFWVTGLVPAEDRTYPLKDMTDRELEDLRHRTDSIERKRRISKELWNRHNRRFW